MDTIGSKRLKIENGQPAVEKLWKGRFRLEFFCSADGIDDWTADTVQYMLPAFGIKMGDKFGEFAWSMHAKDEFDDMRLVETGSEYFPAAKKHFVKLVYETLTGAFVAEKDEDIDFGLNGLQRVTRTFVALPETSYTKVVGTDTITSGGDTLTLGNYSIKKTDAKWELTETWLESGVLSVAQEFAKASTIVQVQAFGLTSSQVSSSLSEVTGSHKLISEQETDFEGIKTSSYTYELDSYDIIDHELNGLERLSRSRILAAATPYTGDVGVTTITNGGKTLYLASFNVEDTATYRSVDEIYVEAGVLNTSKTTESTGIVRVSTTYLAVEDATSDPIVSRSTQNVEGLKTISVSTLQRSDGGAITDTTPTNSFGAMFNFTYPGIAGASSVVTTSVQNGVVVDDAINRFFYQSSPVQRPIPATSYVFFQTDPLPASADYIYDGASGLWSPSEWAGGIYFGWRYQRDNFGTPIGERPSFRGFRTAEVGEIADVFQSITGTATDDDGLSGTLLLADTTFEISVSGGPEKPDGNKYTLGTIDIEPAFEDVDGVQYYKKIITVATIPAQGGSVIT